MKKSTALKRAALLLVLAHASTLAAITFTNNTTISDSRYDGQEIVVDKCVVTVSGVHTFASLQVHEGGMLTAPESVTGLAVVVSGDVLVSAGGRLGMDEKGSATGQGGGSSLGVPLAGSGGGYGGNGGQAAGVSRSGGTYGSVVEPTGLGSGGGAGLGGPGGKGGGLINLKVGGTLRVDGAVSANGGKGLNSRSGGGSGGSIWISAKELSGTGWITAEGGDGEPGAGGGGGGGRIALDYGQNRFTGAVAAKGGNGYQAGGAGSIYMKADGATPKVQFDNGGRSGVSEVTEMPSSIDLVIGPGANLVPKASLVLRSLIIQSGGWLLVSNPTSTITVSGDTLVESGGGISADRSNSASTQGNGSQSQVSGLNVAIGGGGGHGGNGGGMPPSYALGYGSGGSAFGSLSAPVEVGGRGGGTLQFGGLGGGAMRLTVNGLLVCNGRISADGGDGQDAYAGGGAGGSLLINVGTLAGGGIISANGGAGIGDGVYGGGGGGGGRISIQFGGNLFLGSIVARGGSSLYPGGAGTVYLKRTGSEPGQVLVDNGGQRGTNTLLNGGTASRYDLTVRGSAVVLIPTETVGNLLLASNGWIVVSSSPTSTSPTAFRVNGNAIIEAGGGILGDGAGYTSGMGPGRGAYSTYSPYTRLGGGGAYGGYGGTGFALSSTNKSAGGNAYGSVITPTERGSGGGGDARTTGGSGGGVVDLRVSGALEIGGVISANGNPGTSLGGGGGSGGSVLIEAGALTGTGVISADGGNGNGQGGGGGGGRIAIKYTSGMFTGRISAFGGLGGIPGGAGTVYMKPASGAVRVIANNDGRAGTNTLVSAVDVAFDLEIADGACVWPSGFTLVVSNLSLLSGGILTFQPTQAVASLTVRGAAMVESNALISVDGKGYAIGAGPGAGFSTNQAGSGAGYGGVGGASSRSPGGKAYGFAAQPLENGSGGGRGYGTQVVGSEGGGVLRFIVQRALLLDGGISANGKPALNESAGGGAGGSVWIDAGSFHGCGFIRARGGAGELLEGGGGAGGRVAVYAPLYGFQGSVSVAGGEGFEPGETGSVFFAEAPIPLKVVSQTPTGTLEHAVDSVVLQLNTLVNRFTLSPADFVISDPEGLPVTVTLSVTTNGGPSTVRASFERQTKEGVYTVRFGPQVENIHGASMMAMYTGSFRIDWPVVLGSVLDTNHHAVAGVLLQPSAGGASATTDSQGFYTLKIPPLKLVTVTPTRTGMVFDPAIRQYQEPTGTLMNQDYVARPSGALALASRVELGNLILGWEGGPGTQYQVESSTNLVDWAACNDSATCINRGERMEAVFPVDSRPQKFFRVKQLP